MQCTIMEFAALTQTKRVIEEKAGNQYSAEKNPNIMPLQEKHHISFWKWVLLPDRWTRSADALGKEGTMNCEHS